MEWTAREVRPTASKKRSSGRLRVITAKPLVQAKRSSIATRRELPMEASSSSTFPKEPSRAAAYFAEHWRQTARGAA